MLSALVLADRPVVITDHAIEKLRERFPEAQGLKSDPEVASRIEHLLGSSEEQKIDDLIRVRRIINNNFTEASYFYNRKHDLRFVVVEEDGYMVVVTVEKPHQPLPAGVAWAGTSKRRRRRRIEEKEKHRNRGGYCCT